MKYKIQSKLNDGFKEDPGVIVEVGGPDELFDVGDLFEVIYDNFSNDYGTPFGVGSQVIITRTE